MATFLHVLYLSGITTLVWFVVGAIVFMNPVVAKQYAKYREHPSMKHFSSQRKYLIGILFIGGLIPILGASIVYTLLGPFNPLVFWAVLYTIRIIPRACDMWMQTSYPNTLLAIELVNGGILCGVTAYMFSVL